MDSTVLLWKQELCSFTGKNKIIIKKKDRYSVGVLLCPFQECIYLGVDIFN